MEARIVLFCEDVLLSFSGTCSNQSIKVPGCTATQQISELFNNLGVVGNQEEVCLECQMSTMPMGHASKGF